MSVPQEVVQPGTEAHIPPSSGVLEGMRTVGYRMFDCLVAAFGLALATPLILIILLMIRLDSPGPALFRQQRLGLHAKPFWFFKFRTMYVDARERFPELYAYRYSSDDLVTLRFKMQNDPRLTRVGSWLRRTSLDELPNLLNVLKGDMRLVGPRPEIPQMLQYYQPAQMRKWSVPPGVTGLAQVCGRAFLRFQETIEYDLYYVQHRSLLFDLRILWLTVWKVLFGVGAF